MQFLDEYNKIIREYFDLKDRDTRKTIISLEESAEQNQLLAALTSKLYDKIVEKVDDIDFGTLPRSRGDITKIENYSNLMECIDIMRGIVVEYKEDTYPVDVVSSAVENVKSRKGTFTKAYALNVEMPIVLYNTVVLAIVASVSFLISGCIEYVKDPGAETFTIALDRVGYNKTAHNLLFENLANFNEACKKGDIDVAIEDVMRNNRRIGESADEAIDFGGTPVVFVSNTDTEEVPAAVTSPTDDAPGAEIATVEVEDEPEKIEIEYSDDEEEPACDEPPCEVPPCDVPECEPDAPGCIPAYGTVCAGEEDAAVGPFHPDVPADAFEHDAINDDAEEVHEDKVDKINAHRDLPKIPGISLASKALIAIAKVIVPALQNLVYYFYQTKQDVSDYFAIQAELVQMNAYKVQYNTDIDAAKRKDIYTKQTKIADRLKKMSNKLSITYGKSSKAASDMIKSEKKKIKTSDLGVAAPAGSALF